MRKRIGICCVALLVATFCGLPRSASAVSEEVLYSFTGGTDGGSPVAGLLGTRKGLYGTTSIGGAYGYGTVFALTPLRRPVVRGRSRCSTPSPAAVTEILQMLR